MDGAMKPNHHICSLNLSSGNLGAGNLSAGKPDAEKLGTGKPAAGKPETGDLNTDPPANVPPPACPTRERLADAFALLDKILVDRMCQEDVAWGRLIEDRIVWRELIELELQEVDEQIERIAAATGSGWQR
jgi:hypothetical protein